ncbi:heme o synthase [Marinicrinis lubricantis]|uniref:Protoheme IX farnesyltransferase n=1 Tax=Marinicrinis lubricantis TaxID=2086470 RepID=A0ABW1IQR6_9BACL
MEKAADSLVNPSSREDSVTWKDYVQITKPRIIQSNLIAAFGGFWVASKWDIDWLLLIQVLIGCTLVMASACVFNNYLDRELDTKMDRTRERPTATGKLKPSHVLVYGSILGLIGLAVLLLINLWSAILGIVGMFVYVVVYTLWLKRTSTWSTSMGGVSGAMPPMIGYVAVTGEVDMGAWLLFAFLFLWQPPHFWALGIRRKEEYRAAGFPLLPVVKGVKRTKLQMIPYVVLLIVFPILMYTYKYTGMIFLVAGVLLALVWLIICFQGFTAKNDEAWSKKAFMFSVNYLMIMFLIMILDTATKA